MGSVSEEIGRTERVFESYSVRYPSCNAEGTCSRNCVCHRKTFGAIREKFPDRVFKTFEIDGCRDYLKMPCESCIELHRKRKELPDCASCRASGGNER